MADSSFDPLGMVKAMGPQRDPYSWAAIYAEDAAKGKLHAEDMKNRLLIQEMVRAERAKEGALDRASREGIAERSQIGLAERLKESLKAGRYSGGGRGTTYDFPGDKQPKTEKEWRRFSRTPEAKDYRGVQIGGKMVYYHKDNPPVPKFSAPAATVAPATGAGTVPSIPPGTLDDDDYP